jgi:SAM-dependent methyltransferase
LQNKWDKKAHRYGRYTPEGDHLERIICDLMGEMGVDFAGKRVVDIGCGTGIYTLRVAQRAAHIDALDISGEMIKILEEDTARYGFENIHPFHSGWEEFPLPNAHYDYALSTMSPATRDAAGFAKMHRSATTKIFLGWGASGARSSSKSSSPPTERPTPRPTVPCGSESGWKQKASPMT